MDKNSLFSIITTVYNREDCKERCIQSVQNNTYKDFEHIIVDDGSKYKTYTFTLELKKELKVENFEVLYIVIAILFFALKNRLFKYFCLISFAIFIFIYSPSNLVMDFAARFKFGIFFPLILCAILCNKNVLNNSSFELNNKFKYLAAFIILLVPFVHFNNYFSNTFRASYNNLHKYQNIGKNLAEFNQSNCKLLIGDAGIIPFYSNLINTDILGLANSYIARNGFNEEYFKNEDIDIAIMYSFYKNKKVQDYLDENYKKMCDIYLYPWNVSLIFYFKNSTLEKLEYEKVNKFIVEIDKLNSDEFNLKDYIMQKYIINY